MSACSISDCGRGPYCRGWCKKHYDRWYKHGDPLVPGVMSGWVPFDERFERSYEKGSEKVCWPWIGARTTAGYGTIGRDCKTLLAHRVAYIKVNGPIPDGMHICHHCDNPRCVNPNHLFCGTASDNSVDMIRKGRQPRQKLCELDVWLVRNVDCTAKKIAEFLGISTGYAYDIRYRRAWKHVP